jgi:hypothetical protein
MRLPRLPASMSRRLPIFSASAVAALLCGCLFGGTGTDTDNGVGPNQSLSTGNISARVLGADGKPIANVSFAVSDPLFRPDSGKAQANLWTDSVHAPVSNAKGFAAFTMLKEGTYVLEGSSGGKVVFFDTLKEVNLKVVTSITFTTRESKAFKGKVKLVSGMHVDSGAVFIRGTRRWVKVDASGSYDLGILPIDVARMGVGIRYSSSPTAVLEVNQSQTISEAVKYTCKDVSKDTLNKALSPSFPGSLDSAKDTAQATRAANSLDTVKINAAVNSCDTVPKGALLTVKVEDPQQPVSTMKKDSVSVPYIVTGAGDSIYVTYKEISYDHVILFNQCVEAPGVEKTTFGIELQPTDDGSDLLVGDLADKCAKP